MITDRAKVVFAFLFLLLLGLCLYHLSSAPTRVSALSMGPPPSKTRATASRAVCLSEPAFSGGPPPGFTGAPGEETCHFCHDSYKINDPSGDVTIDLLLPDSYVPAGDPIPFTVTVSQDGTNGANIDWGFEITVLDANNLFAGTLMVTDTLNTRMISGEVNGSTRFYIEQTLDGIFFNLDGAPSATWNMAWVPPVTDVGPVTFYVAGNAGAGRGRSGTYVFTNSRTVLGPGANFVAHALPLSDLRHGPKAVWLARFARAPRFVPLN